MPSSPLTATHVRSVVAIEAASEQSLSPAQRKYNAALEKIEKQKVALEQWQQAHEQCQRQVAGKYEPLRQQLVNEQVKLVCVFDDHLMTTKLTKNQRSKLTSIIIELCEQLIDETDHAELHAIYQRYLPEETRLTDEEQAEMDAALRSAFEDAFGFSLDESVDVNDPDMIAKHLFEQQQAYQAQHQAQRARKKTAKQLEKEAKEKAEAESAQESIQAIYRQLVKALHPDREADEARRARKTQLMQAVTVAYEEKNLIKLLELQLQETQVSQQLHQLSDNKIQSFIKLLEQQWQQLKAETQQIEQRYKMMLGMAHFDRLTPKKLQSYLKEDIARLEQQLQQTRSDRRNFEQDIDYFKAWLKYYRLNVDDDWT